MSFDLADGNFFTITQKGLAEGQEVTNVHTLIAKAEPSAPPGAVIKSTDILSSWDSQMWTIWQKPLFPANYAPTEYILRQVIGVNRTPMMPPYRYNFTYGYEESFLPAPATAVGDRAGPFLPTYAAVSVRMKGNTLSGTAKGGKRFGPLPEADVGTAGEPDRLLPATIADWQALADKMLIGQAVTSYGNSWRYWWIVWDKKEAYMSTLPFGWGYINLCRVHTYVSTQNSRKRPLD